MSVEFRITRGARAGASERFEKSIIAIGRHPMNDLRFDPAKDLDVSSRHAELRSVGDRHVLHDLGSTNGTLVNGSRITGEQELREGDIISFGADGPQVIFHLTELPVATTPSVPRVENRAGRPATPDAPAAGVGGMTHHAPPRQPPERARKNTEVRIAEAVQKQTGRLRQMVLALAAIVLAGGALAVWINIRTSEAGRQQVAQLIARNDSLAGSLETRLSQTGVAEDAWRAAESEIQRLTRELRSRQAAGGDVSELSAEMRVAQQRTASFARTDFSAILSANKAAVVFIAVQMPDGSSSSGTGFNILPSGLIVTNRHVVRSVDGVRATRIGVAFDETRGAWREATIEYVSETDELAFLRLARGGNYPVVTGIAGDSDRIRIGEPVAIFGFPLGTATAGNEGDIDNLRPVATLGIGTVSKTLPDNIQLDAYAAQGSSGSPVFDSRGLVIGVLFGAAAESNGRIIYTVPSARLSAQLPRDAVGVIR